MKTREIFRHLTESDRDRLHALFIEGHSQKSIAEVIGVNPATISRELARYNRRTWRYSATRAQADADLKRRHSKRPGMKIEENPDLKREIISELKQLRSPDEIAGRMTKEKRSARVGTNAIYKWLYSDAGKPYCKYLCTRRSFKRRQSHLKPKILIPNRISVKYRPNTEGLIHAEGDLFVSPIVTHDKTSGVLVVVPEAHLLSGKLVPNKTKQVIIPTMQEIIESLPLDTCTFDNGIENVHHNQFGVQAYFCDKSSPWQKPHVESSIGLIRRWFIPKGTILATIDDKTFQSQLHLLNSKYRKSLNYSSAYEVALERGIINKVPRISLSKAIAFR